MPYLAPQLVYDVQCNSAMSIYSELKRQGNTRFTSPRSLAETIVKELPDNDGLFDDASVAGPGFINVSFSTSALASRVQMLIQDSGGCNGLFFRKILTRDVLSPPQTERRHSHSQ